MRGCIVGTIMAPETRTGEYYKILSNYCDGRWRLYTTWVYRSWACDPVFGMLVRDGVMTVTIPTEWQTNRLNISVRIRDRDRSYNIGTTTTLSIHESYWHFKLLFIFFFFDSYNTYYKNQNLLQKRLCTGHEET